MAGQKGRSGSGGKRKGAGRPKGAVDAQPRYRIAKSLAVPKWEFAEKAQQYADRMLDVLVAVANNVEAPEATRVSAAGKSLDRALGKAPEHVHHTEIVYRSASQIRQELINRGVPEVFICTPRRSGADQPPVCQKFYWTTRRRMRTISDAAAS